VRTVAQDFGCLPTLRSQGVRSLAKVEGERRWLGLGKPEVEVADDDVQQVIKAGLVTLRGRTVCIKPDVWARLGCATRKATIRGTTSRASSGRLVIFFPTIVDEDGRRHIPKGRSATVDPADARWVACRWAFRIRAGHATIAQFVAEAGEPI
jgi:hypothetical protein